MHKNKYHSPLAGVYAHLWWAIKKLLYKQFIKILHNINKNGFD